MVIAVTSAKGGVGKTTTAIHLAAFLQTQGNTLLVDSDDTRNATTWANRGQGMPFQVADEIQAGKLSRKFDHVVIDTGQRLRNLDIKALAERCDLLVIPAVPANLDTDGLVLTIQALQGLGISHYRVLLTKVPPAPETEGHDLRQTLKGLKVPVFKGQIPRLKAYEKAAGAGLIVSSVDDRNAARAWAAVEAVGKELKHGSK